MQALNGNRISAWAFRIVAPLFIGMCGWWGHDMTRKADHLDDKGGSQTERIVALEHHGAALDARLSRMESTLDRIYDRITRPAPPTRRGGTDSKGP